MRHKLTGKRRGYPSNGQSSLHLQQSLAKTMQRTLRQFWKYSNSTRTTRNAKMKKCLEYLRPGWLPTWVRAMVIRLFHLVSKLEPAWPVLWHPQPGRPKFATRPVELLRYPIGLPKATPAHPTRFADRQSSHLLPQYSSWISSLLRHRTRLRLLPLHLRNDIKHNEPMTRPINLD